MTTITRLKQLKAWMTGQQKAERIKRQAEAAALKQVCEQVEQALLKQMGVGILPNRFTSYRNKIMPKLQASGYHYFLACASNDYQEHEEWCHENCEDFTLPHCDVWQFDSQYPRAFASQADAMLFCLTFDAYEIGGDE